MQPAGRRPGRRRRDVGGVQGRVAGAAAGRPARPPTGNGAPPAWPTARWITADMAYRRAALAAVGGFDERLPRAFREDAELAYRVRPGGLGAAPRHRGRSTHPVRPESRWVSLRTQRGNADDALLRRLYGPRWRTLLDIPPGRRPRHVADHRGRRCRPGRGGRRLRSRRRRPAVGAVAAAGWAAGTAEFAAARIAPGPRDRARGGHHAGHQRADPAGRHRPLAARLVCAGAGCRRLAPGLAACRRR